MEARTGQSTPAITAPVPAPVPPPSTRRPRVREVSPRFMSPVASSSSSGDLHLPTSNADVRKQAHKAEAERMFYSLGLKMSELSRCVHKKRIELQGLMRVKAIKEIVEPQMPLLEQWTTLEEEYSTSLSETTEALLNASLRLPLDADIKVETKELGDVDHKAKMSKLRNVNCSKCKMRLLGEVLAVASKSMEGIVQNIGQFLPKTQGIESLLSELARVSSREKVAVEDCGVALLKTHSSHVEDCYLRSQLIQQHHKQCEAGETDTVEANKNKGNVFRR
ncbi:hypothetical protein F2Q68_00028388 [Brassica cretica]|uniref:Uncharacterized protein n=1 Tax=Brassica cretica TaxID=69181 RepID=A0A8S9I9W4_BRACR|nr:hypothetical protein F2Q68_00028388 [Brassica cretica]